MIDILQNPSPDQLGRSPDEFLQRLQNPTLILLDGRDNSRTRAFATLLHGNEPSGFFALHRWLLMQETPPVKLAIFIGNVLAAKLAPGFSYRQLPGGRDLNRCFRQPFDGVEGEVAHQLLDMLHELRPEALIDMHNTSGTGPSFGVTVQHDDQHQALTALFTDRLMYTDIKLGALMEFSERDVPTVTIEVGGSQDEHAHQLAWDGLLRYVRREDVLTLPEGDWGVEVLRNPVRVEIAADASLAFAEQPAINADITLRPDIEHFNFGVLKSDVRLGWVGARGLNAFRVFNRREQDICHKVLRVVDGALYPAQSLKAFMITTNHSIALSDCLCYLVTEHGEQIY